MRLSVIIPAYNTEKYIENCIENIVASIQADSEIIVVDDGSTDLTGSIIDKYSVQYDFIKVCHIDNSGVSNARNTGIDMARGEYIYFADSDDALARDYIKNLLYEATEKNADIVFAGFTEVDEQTEIKNVISRKLLEINDVCSGKEFAKLKCDLQDRHNEVWCALFKRSFIVSKQLYFDKDLPIYEDVLFTIKAVLLADKISTVNKYGYFYRVREDSLLKRGDSYIRDIKACVIVISKLRIWAESQDEKTKCIVGRFAIDIASMSLYYLGECARNKETYDYYKQICSKDNLAMYRSSATTNREHFKVIIFTLCPFLYRKLLGK